MSDAGYVTFEYNPGANAPESLRKVFNFKAHSFKVGEKHTVAETVAWDVIASAWPGSIKIVSGTPKQGFKLPKGAKPAVQTLRQALADSKGDPALALASLPVLPAEVVTALRGKVSDLEAAVSAGKHDESCGLLSVVAQMLGLDKLAKLAAQRAASAQVEAAKLAVIES